MSAIGQNLPMIDAEERVTGRINYALNVELPGMLHGRILRSPFAHARLKHIDGSLAEHFPGVAAVLTRNDFAQASDYSGKYGRIFRDQSVVVLDKVRFIGDPVVVVVVFMNDIAEEVFSLIWVD